MKNFNNFYVWPSKSKKTEFDPDNFKQIKPATHVYRIYMYIHCGFSAYWETNLHNHGVDVELLMHKVH